jgi:DNA-binding transcriptional ArsR family regulator
MNASSSSNTPAATTSLDLATMREHAGEAAQLLKALANEHRLLLLCTLAEGEMSVGQLNERVALSQSALSQHLALLRRDGLVTTRRVAQQVFYSLTDGPGSHVIKALHELYCGPLR